MQSDILKISHRDWNRAQKYEQKVWSSECHDNSKIKALSKFIKVLPNWKQFLKYIEYRDWYCGDDWNYWWLDKFDEYKMLPKTLEAVLEVGCGPFTNLRLIEKGRKFYYIMCVDPLIHKYVQYKNTWLARKAPQPIMHLSPVCGEGLVGPANRFKLSVCINVLDHVQNSLKCISELIRVTMRGGYIVIGQDLTNSEDLKNRKLREDVGHPIKITHEALDEALEGLVEPVFKKVLPREEGRTPIFHYGTYLFVGKKV